MQIFVILACIVAASGGMLFGYDGGVTGGGDALHQHLELALLPTATTSSTNIMGKNALSEDLSAHLRSLRRAVESMEQFRRWFFPSTLESHDTTFYCLYNDKILATYSALMHFTGALASIPAGWFTQKQGRTRYCFLFTPEPGKGIISN